MNTIKKTPNILSLLKRFSQVCSVFLIATLLACTEKEPDEPIVLELIGLPKSISINDKYFHPKPFSIRAKYSDGTEKNITSNVTWLSENVSLITVSKTGEIKRKGDCNQLNCPVSIIATHKDSGKSIRLTVNLKQKKVSKENADKNSNSEVDAGTKDQAELAEKNAQDDVDKTVGETPFQVGLSPNVETGEKSPLNNSSNTTNEIDFSQISKLKLVGTQANLISGETFQPSVIALNEVGTVLSSVNLQFTCENTDPLNASIKVVEPGCQLVAIAPGNAQIRLSVQQAGLPSLENNVIDIHVEPIIIDSSASGFSRVIQLLPESDQIWLQITGLDNQAFYRAALSGQLGQTTKIYTYTGPKICSNTVPLNANQVACYFNNENNNLMIVIEEKFAQLIEATLDVISANNDLFQNLAILSSLSPQPLLLGNAVSNFVLANEEGGNNRHYYTFKIDNKSDSVYRIKVFDFDALVKLNVSWSGGFCNPVFQAGEVFCDIPKRLDGSIMINVDGNNGADGLENGPAAASGGAHYRLVVDIKE